MTKRFLSTWLLFALAFLFSGAAQAADLDSHARAASELLDAMHVEQNVNQALDIMIKVQLQANPELTQYEDVLHAYLSKYMAWDALRDDYIHLYEGAFSEKELKDLVAFYKTPTGQKLASTLPQLIKKSAELGQAKVAAHLDELKAEVAARAQELNESSQPH